MQDKVDSDFIRHPPPKKKTFKKSYPIVSIQFGNPQFISVINKVNDFEPFFSFFGQHFKVEKVMATFVTPYSLGISNHVCREPQISEYERALPKCMHCFVVVDISGFLGKVCKVIWQCRSNLKTSMDILLNTCLFLKS